MNISTHPIVALATPQDRSALAIIRLSGDGVHELFADVVTEKEKFALEKASKIAIYTIVDDVSRETSLNTGRYECGNIDDINVSRETLIDEVTAVKYIAPRSFTGEDMVEIFCHGGAVIPQKILDRLFRAGARAAGRGEFSRRAFLNGKIDLLKAESIVGLIDCQTERHLKSAQFAYGGKQLKSLEILKDRIISVLSNIESRIEFAEEEDIAASQQGLLSANKRELELIINELEEDLRRNDQIRSLDNGIIIALAGPPNAGKSSLFNEILGYDRSIVHDRPGTTRDAVSEKILFDGVTVKLFDCAGIRDTDDAVEQRGIERTLSAVKDAHIVIWVTSADTPFGVGECEEILENRDKALAVINKIDLAGEDVSRETLPSSRKNDFCRQHNIPYAAVSLTQKINIDALFDTIKTFVHNISDDIPAPSIIINERHRRIAVLMIAELRDCVIHLDREEIAAHYLKNILNLIAEFLGHVAGDEILDDIFGRFCIGK